MSKLKQRIGSMLQQTFDLPSEVTLELPRITMVGSIHAYIENHHGLLVFQDQELRVKVYGGFVRIKGERFVLKMMIEQEILLEGTINEVTFHSDKER
ncbi:hypothetical protein J416_05838 [Gracilibacillus halophilus YIM-C55.5]|uniref:Sporulation protein YqfC n=1 Tax=Gracilibacillus halophilus YIM-C55.5 TaxID=1308866 RepID=N4WB49_9BACI|nr:sporulation protein YqfC [Gracilibacillus halophilus]ENH97508.1 hypothetical protein J416_05838 [Gracilibacillus halophilus YIM-C55.5]